MQKTAEDRRRQNRNKHEFGRRAKRSKEQGVWTKEGGILRERNLGERRSPDSQVGHDEAGSSARGRELGKSSGRLLCTVTN